VDKNHIHHKLLALGFVQHEAVMLIYIIQALLFVIAYFMRYESDLRILTVVVGFFAIFIAVMQIAARTGWRIRHGSRRDDDAAMPRPVISTPRATSLPRVTYAALASALGLYAALIVIDMGSSMTGDIRMLMIALFAMVVGALAVMRSAPLTQVERGAIYVTATVLVYLDAIVLRSNLPVSILSWAAVSVAAVATAIRLRHFNDRRFEPTPLDIIVLFMALVVPNLPGTLGLPHGGALAIAKLVVVYYAIAMLISRQEGGTLWVRIAVVSVLAGLVLRSYAVI
jgi:UDP-GlcNAc:undecaprenyl-phosphate GlcNAc-1-phosphate transferase